MKLSLTALLVVAVTSVAAPSFAGHGRFCGTHKPHCSPKRWCSKCDGWYSPNHCCFKKAYKVHFVRPACHKPHVVVVY